MHLTAVKFNAMTKVFVLDALSPGYATEFNDWIVFRRTEAVVLTVNTMKVCLVNLLLSHSSGLNSVNGLLSVAM